VGVPTDVARVKLKPHHVPTGNTRHILASGRVIEPVLTSLCIVHDEDSSGVFLFYCDDDGVALADTWHQTVDDAKAQAEFEFSVRPNEWGSA